MEIKICPKYFLSSSYFEQQLVTMCLFISSTFLTKGLNTNYYNFSLKCKKMQVTINTKNKNQSVDT